ncbi:class I SAM-dependent methyltransferase [Nitrosococcus watsonii]|uniref:Methyltransferase type 11 n=1 Tax=Nitrosococcus watsoni (strain C-113) TaxID=105559 RepID=D8K9F3_NITWC|nr:methyltransferase domain-containing protein [Nitrosococcus watsonii]ADJ27242.1 Methyltransferase type 11 [Nitrosococcus watsonii C-113]
MNTLYKWGYPSRQAFCVWLGESLGRHLLKIEQAELEKVLPDLFGYHLVQLGSVRRGMDLLSSSCIWHRVVLEAEIWPEAQAPSLLSHVDALPFASATVDGIILPHVLEYEENPHQVLREVQRVLVPYGTLAILGFNPWSFWGFWRFILYRRGSMPWCGRFYSPTRIQDWLALLGFKTVELRYFLFRPPLRQPRLMRRLRFLELIGRRWCPFFAGGYLVVAKKQVVRLNPIDSLWCEKESLDMPVLAEPTTRERCRD